jgi:hypothetical protein
MLVSMSEIQPRADAPLVDWSDLVACQGDGTIVLCKRVSAEPIS